MHSRRRLDAATKAVASAAPHFGSLDAENNRQPIRPLIQSDEVLQGGAVYVHSD